MEGQREVKVRGKWKGDTDLSWDHEGLEPHLEPSKPKPPRNPKSSRAARPRVRDEQPPVKISPKCMGNHNEKDCPKFLFKEDREREAYTSQPVKQSLQTDKSEAKFEEKWELGKKDSVIKKDTENGWKKKMNSLKRKKKSRKRGSL